MTFMLIWYYLTTKFLQKIHSKGDVCCRSNKMILNISEMNCMHCSSTDQKATDNVEGTSYIG